MATLSSGHVFATVGTTKFDLLVHTLTSDDVLRELKKRGYKALTVQYGKGSYIPKDGLREGIQLRSYRFKDTIVEDILRADLVISHAGAGTCLEVLDCQKKLLVVVNKDLMDNHQAELAEKLSENNHVVYSTPENLSNAIRTMDLSKLLPVPPSNAFIIARFIDKFTGFDPIRPLSSEF